MRVRRGKNLLLLSLSKFHSGSSVRFTPQRQEAPLCILHCAFRTRHAVPGQGFDGGGTDGFEGAAVLVAHGMDAGH